MNKYEDMSDFEINLQVAMMLFEEFEQIRQSINGGSEIYVDNGNSAFYDFDCGTFDYCNNPSDAWPIIFENGISIQPTGESWISGSSILGSQFIDKNPLRAAMICFLKMKDAESNAN